MIDFNDLKQRPEIYRTAAINKNVSVDIDALLNAGERRVQLLQEVEALRAQRNTITNEVQTPGISADDRAAKIATVRELKPRLAALEAELTTVEADYFTLLAKVPNLPSHDTPIGKDDSENVVLRSWGTTPGATELGFAPLEHWQIAEPAGWIDSERAVKLSGSRFAFLLGDLARLQFALLDFAVREITHPDFLSKVEAELGVKINTPAHAFRMAIPPVLIKPEPFARMARLEPREQRYYVPEDDLYLIGSAEHTLGAMYMDETIAAEELPVRLLGYSTAFRREAGTYGKDMKGILRMHQFDKLELESFTMPEHSLQEQDTLVAIQEYLMRKLNLPYRVVICCTGDQGDPDARHLDLEAWLPGQNTYRETHSADLMTDYQARRLKTYFKTREGERGLVHTNDATAFAVGRTLIAIIENYQQADGSVMIPEVLRAWMGQEKLNA